MKKIEEAPDLDLTEFDADLLLDPVFMEKVKGFDERYLHWDELRYRVDDDDLKKTWYAMKYRRRLASMNIDLCDKKCSFCMTPAIIELLHYIDRDAAGRVETRISGETDAKRYMASSLMEEAIASSQMEGAATTRRDAKRMLRSGSKPKTPDEKMILNNYIAMQEIKSRLDEPLTKELILELHSKITQGTLRYGDEWAGRFRDSDDIVVGDTIEEGKIYHIPPEHTRIQDLIEDLCRFANEGGDSYIHPIIKAIILHYMIGYIHPFVDGNGRLARSLFYWYSIKNGYWLFEYASISTVIKKSQVKYSYAYQYTETDGDDLTYFIKFNLECIRKSVDELTDYMDRKSKEQQLIRELIDANQELNHIEAMIIKDLLKDQTVISIYEIRGRYNVSYETARRYARHLVDLGYLEPAGKDRKKQFYKINVKNIAGV